MQAERPPGVPVNILVEESPHVYREILVQAERLNAGLVVMGTHGRSGFERLFLGSTAEKSAAKGRLSSDDRSAKSAGRYAGRARTVRTNPVRR